MWSRRYLGSRGRSLAAAAVMLGGAAALADVRYRIIWIAEAYWNYKGGVPSDPQDINDLAQVCGLLSNGDLVIADLWDIGTQTLTDFESLPSCSGPGTSVRGLSNTGKAVGFDRGEDCQIQGWIWSPTDGVRELPRLPGFFSSVAFAINIHDRIVGRQITFGPPSGDIACAWDPEEGTINISGAPAEYTITAIEINDADNPWVVGTANGPGGGAFRWRWDERQFEIVITNGTAVAVNIHGEFVGYIPPTPELGGRAYRWNPQTESPEIISPGYGYPVDINDAGTVIGETLTAEDTLTSFVWDPRRGWRDLNQLYAPCEIVGEPLLPLLAVAINNHGQILCKSEGFPGFYVLPAVVLMPMIVGDLNEDAACDLQDLATLLSNFGRSGDSTYATGDLDCDRDTDIADLAVLLANFGETLP